MVSYNVAQKVMKHLWPLSAISFMVYNDNYYRGRGWNTSLVPWNGTLECFGSLHMRGGWGPSSTPFTHPYTICARGLQVLDIVGTFTGMPHAHCVQNIVGTDPTLLHDSLILNVTIMHLEKWPTFLQQIALWSVGHSPGKPGSLTIGCPSPFILRSCIFTWDLVDGWAAMVVSAVKTLRFRTQRTEFAAPVTRKTLCLPWKTIYGGFHTNRKSMYYFIQLICHFLIIWVQKVPSLNHRHVYFYNYCWFVHDWVCWTTIKGRLKLVTICNCVINPLFSQRFSACQNPSVIYAGRPCTVSCRGVHVQSHILPMHQCIIAWHCFSLPWELAQLSACTPSRARAVSSRERVFRTSFQKRPAKYGVISFLHAL